MYQPSACQNVRPGTEWPHILTLPKLQTRSMSASLLADTCSCQLHQVYIRTVPTLQVMRVPDDQNLLSLQLWSRKP